MALTDKQEQFCLEYLVDLNGTKAAERAGYSVNSAYSISSENMRKPEILTRIKELMDERSKETMVDATFVVEGFKEVFNRCMTKVPVMTFDYMEKRMVQKTEENENGEEVGVWEFDSMGANKALEMLGKHLAMFTDKTKTDGKVSVTVNYADTINPEQTAQSTEAGTE